MIDNREERTDEIATTQKTAEFYNKTGKETDYIAAMINKMEETGVHGRHVPAHT